MRVGIGYDSHRFAEEGTRKLVLGGVEIPHPRGLAGHSDGDAVAHALIDAILGAAGLGDIGTMFPSSDPRWRDADSLGLLKRAYLKVVTAGHNFVSADITVITEQPRLTRYIDDMREKLAGALVSGYSAISVTAKTHDGMGWIGRGEGVAVIAVALLEAGSPPRAASA
jgi:2-C-methyl-D-erythritol 2,4-cyclodiphosphate synthase